MILTNPEKIILEPEDWSTEEWKVFCKLAQTDPTKCESIQIEAEALKVYEKATIIPHFKTQNKAVPFELLFRGNYFYYNNQIFIKTGTEKDVTNAVCLTNYGTPIFITNNAQVNLITELRLEYKD